MAKPRKTVLIVGDDKDVSNAMELSLGRRNYRVVIATAAEIGLTMTRIRRPDLIICNYARPVVEGLNLCQMIRDVAADRQIPVFFCSDSAKEEDVRQAISFGIKGYLLKPFSINILMEKVDEVFGP